MTPKQIHIQWETEALSPGLKLAECQADHVYLLLKLGMSGSIFFLIKPTEALLSQIYFVKHDHD
jgi:hypothetical protein